MSAADRFKATITAVVLELLPDLRFRAPARYVVDKCEGGKLTATPKSSKSGLPPIVDMPVRGSIAGGMASKLKKGTSVLIMWIDASPADPFLAWIDSSEEPDELKLEGQTKATLKAPDVKLEGASSVKADAPSIVLNGGAQGVARMGDTVQAGPWPGTITSGSATVKAG